MSDQDYELTTMGDIDVTLYINEFENEVLDGFDDIQLSDSVLDNASVDQSLMLTEYLQANNNDGFFDTPQSPVTSTDTIVNIPDIQTNNNAIIDNQQIVVEDEFDQSLDYNLYEETIVTQENQQYMTKVQEQTCSEVNINPFDSIDGNMVVKEQPKPDQRVRYESDGPRFLPESKKHPMSIQLPDLSSKSLAENEIFGIVLTMVTSACNPKGKEFIHVNDIKYRTNDAIEIGNGSLFIPINKSEIQKSEKLFPRLSIICKKFDKYTFDLISFDSSTSERITEKYTLTNEDVITKTAKGKQFTDDYDLLCYKIVFQLALKQDDNLMISHIKCETKIINEQKAPTQGVKRKASPNDKMPKKRKDSINMAILSPSKKFKSSIPPFIECSVIRTSNRKK